MEPKIRLATAEDYSAIYEIWMQPHVIQWMSFKPGKSAEDFRPVYEKLASKSEIYVAVADINGKEEVVGVRRLQYGTGNRAHTASYCSMGVREDYLRHGCAGKFYELFSDEIKKKNIKVVVLTQSGGNVAAYKLADKLGFERNVHLNGWLCRKGKKEGSYHYLEERWISLVDEEVKQSVVNKDNSFAPKVPELAPKTQCAIKLQGNDYICYDSDSHENEIGVCTVEPCAAAVSHVAIVTINLKEGVDPALMMDCLRKISVQLSQQNFKKIEICTHEKALISMLEQSGYHYRGETVALLEIEGKHYNEAYMDFGFFNIEDAKILLNALELKIDGYEVARIFALLTECKKAIRTSVSDDYMALYCENLAYQMIENTFGMYPHYKENDAPWQNLITNLPKQIRGNFIELADRLGIKCIASSVEQPVNPPRLPGCFY